MKKRSGIASAIISMIVLLVCGTAAPAQGLLDTVKVLVKDPRFANFVRSKVSSVIPPNQNYQAVPQAFPPPYGNTYPTAYANPAGSAPAPDQPVVTPNGSGMTITKRLAPAELLKLSQYDIEVMIDQSGSMSTRDCPDPFMPGARVSRWDWCRSQSSLLTQQTAGALPSGVTLVPFSDQAHRFENVSPQAINSIFNNAAPQGSTNLAGALKQEFVRHFQMRDRGMSRRPLMIAVITDGVPDSKNAVFKAVKDAAMVTSPGEIKIVFFLIGTEQKGLDFVDELNRRLAEDGRSAIPILSHSFAELNQVGLARSLVMAANDQRRF